MKTRTAALIAALTIGAPALADEYVIELSGMNFVYSGQNNQNIDLTIKPGDSVRWVWVSGFHNVVSGTGGVPDGRFTSGAPTTPPKEFVHTFTTADDYPYYCQVHGSMGMTSTVKVRCAGDFNGDLSVNTLDVLAFLNAWSSGDPRGDFNGDGNINTLDVLAFLNAWSAGC
jgi:plastocyanin